MSAYRELIRTGRVWKVGDNINTDLIFPNSAFRLPLEEQYRKVFSANRPGWVEQVEKGDILIAGKDFGMGSGRPVGRLLGECGIGGVVAESVNGLALRNCINFGMPAIDCRGILSLFEEGQVARIDFRSGLVENLTTGESLSGMALPDVLADLSMDGGILQMLVKKGLIEPTPTLASST